MVAVVVVSALRNAPTRPVSTDGDRAAAPDQGTRAPHNFLFLPLDPTPHPSLHPTNQILAHPLHSASLLDRARPPSLAVRQQNRAKGKRVDRNLRSVCLSCCPPTMIDSLPRSSAIQRRRNGRSNRTTVRAAVFLATPPPHQTRAAIPGSQSLPSPIVYTRRGKPSGQNWNTSGF